MGYVINSYSELSNAVNALIAPYVYEELFT